MEFPSPCSECQRSTSGKCGLHTFYPAACFHIPGVICPNCNPKRDCSPPEGTLKDLIEKAREGKLQGKKPLREFITGAIRDKEEGKLDFEGFFSPEVMIAYSEYMDRHRNLSDGSKRDSDNWQAGMPRKVYIKSAFRHFMDLWLHHRGLGEKAREPLADALAGVLFNIMGYWHEVLKNRSL